MTIAAKQIRFILLALLGLVAIAFLAIAILGLNSLSGKSQKLVEVKLKSKTLDGQLTSLEAAKAQVEEYTYFNDVAKTVLPNDKDQAQAVIDIFNMANQSGIAIASVTFPTSTLGGSSSASASGSATSAVSQAKPVTGIAGLYGLELTITPQTGASVPANKVVTYPKFLDFLNRIEHNRRTAQITQVSIQPEGQAISFSLTVNIFMRPAQ